jgi:iron(III) transport system ATP-binding protein
VLLLDEPLSNLDAKLREQMRAELRELQRRLGVTAVYVTHDQEEALALSDRLAVMRDGEVVALGPPQQLYLYPPDGYTARFLGQMNILPCTVQEHVTARMVRAWTPLGLLHARVGDVRLAAGQRAELMIRPEHIAVCVDGARDLLNVIEGVITSVLFAGRLVEYRVRAAAAEVRVHGLSTTALSEGSMVHLHLPAERCWILPTEGTDAPLEERAAP